MNKLRKISSVKIVAGGFAVLILIGALLLNTSIAIKGNVKPGFVNALFTATSAVCVTGLNVFNTGLYWSPFGKFVILFLIQIGGLGFMTVTTLISFAIKRKISLKERIIMAEALNRNEITGIVNLTKNIIYGTLFFEGIGAIILSARFADDYGLTAGITKGVFHSVSAFCNAGFDTLGVKNSAGSLTAYAYDPVVNITIMFLIIMGGLGFIVWTDILNSRSFKRLKTQSKIVIVTSAVLILGGALFIYLSERTNPNSFGNESTSKQILASIFQSVTCRTAGFETVPQDNFTMPSKMISMLLMFVGGSPGSTAGGVKTVTVTVLILASLSSVRGEENVNAFKRRIEPAVIKKALSVVMLGIFVVFFSTFAICNIESFEIDKILFEVISAFGTVGLSCSLTPYLGAGSKLILIFLMYFGRIGILTIGLAVAQRVDKSTSLYKYASANITVG